MSKKFGAREGRGDMQGEHSRKEIIMCKNPERKRERGFDVVRRAHGYFVPEAGVYGR